MTLQQPPGVVLGADRSIMPVVSVSGVGVGIAATSQMNPMSQSPMSTMQQLPLPVLIVLFWKLLALLNIYLCCITKIIIKLFFFSRLSIQRLLVIK